MGGHCRRHCGSQLSAVGDYIIEQIVQTIFYVVDELP